MERSALAEETAEEIRRRVFDEPGFMRVTQVTRRGGSVFRVSLRPVALQGERRYQGEMTEGGQTTVKNFADDAARRGLEEMLGQTGPRELHLVTATGDLHVRVTRKGKAMVSRSAALQREAEACPAHDRVKRQPLTAFDSGALLRVLGVADADGRVKASMRGKYDQINEFLKVIDTVLDGREERELRIVDCGCGRAYLTLAVHANLTRVRGYTVRVCGIDRQAGVVATARQLAESLGVAGEVTFLEGDIATCEPEFKPDLLLSLHACDTATDEALARGIEWTCRYLLCAPCCQHELHKTLKEGGPMQAVMRHGILRERLADLLTDTFRAQILRVLGFRVRVVEFVSAEATARNLLIRAEYCVKPGQSVAVSEYLALRDFWKVTPWLETRLQRLMEKHLSRY